MILNLESLKAEISKIRKENSKIKVVTTNGAFDIIHAAHVKTSEEAKKLGDILIVFLNSDSSIKKYKGEKRPIIHERERAEIISSLKSVDYVCIFLEDTPLKALSEIKPDIHVKGGTFIQEKIDEEKKLIESWNGIFKTLPVVEGYSTTNIIDKILEMYRE